MLEHFKDFIDADDLLLKNRIEILLDVITNYNPISIIHKWTYDKNFIQTTEFDIIH